MQRDTIIIKRSGLMFDASDKDDPVIVTILSLIGSLDVLEREELFSDLRSKWCIFCGCEMIESRCYCQWDE